MAIWVYKDTSRKFNKDLFYSKPICPFCRSQLKALKSIEKIEKDGLSSWSTKTQREKVEICITCGWWRASKEDSMNIRPTWHQEGAYAWLRNFDLNDIDQPIEELRRYLIANYEKRFNINPRLLEETVASVFKSAGYRARVTSYQNDGGIDVILDGQDNSLIGVQVKRYRNKIGVSQIRELTGALVIGGFTKGMFVTTSTYTKGAVSAADMSSVKGFPIELVDSHRLFDALKIYQKPLYDSYKKWKKLVGNIEMQVISSGHW